MNILDFAIVYTNSGHFRPKTWGEKMSSSSSTANLVARVEVVRELRGKHGNNARRAVWVVKLDGVEVLDSGGGSREDSLEAHAFARGLAFGLGEALVCTEGTLVAAVAVSR